MNQLFDQTGVPVLQDVGLSRSAQELLVRHADMPLVGIRNLGTVMDVSPTNLYPVLRDLGCGKGGAGLLDFQMLGATLDNQNRGRLTGPGRLLLPDRETVRNEDWFRCQLLERLPAVEQSYELLGLLMTVMGKLQGFRWLRGQGADSLATLDDGSTGLFWCGITEDRQHLKERINRFFQAQYLVSWKIWPECVDANYTPVAMPSMLVFIVPDRWQGEMVRQCVERES